MVPNIFQNVCCFGLMLMVTVAISGCKRGGNASTMFAQAVNSDIKRLGTLYIQFQTNNTKNRLQGPSSLEEFKEFIAQQNDRGLHLIGVDKNNLDRLFISPRDNQPYKIRWKVQAVSRGPAQPVVFESEGVNGKYMVGFTGFKEIEVDKAEYDRLWSGAADQEE